MNEDEIFAQISKKPAVHRLCYGAYIQEPIWLALNVLVVPLASLGFDAELNYVRTYLRQFFGVELTSEQLKNNFDAVSNSLPVTVIVYFPEQSSSPQELEEEAYPALIKAENLLSLVSGDRLVGFTYVVAATAMPPVFRLEPPLSRRRQRLGFGNTGVDFRENINRIRQAVDEDDRFAFAMGLFADSAHETNPLFKVCRLFNVLECLAYALKDKQMKIGSRKAIRLMLQLPNEVNSHLNVDGREIHFDRIEIAGGLRDKFFHGSQFRESHLKTDSRVVFYLIKNRPESLVELLLVDCELALARWANDASPARDAAGARKTKLGALNNRGDLMEFKQLDIPDVWLITPRIFGDDRGFFYESFSAREFEKHVGYAPCFVQDNHSKSTRGVLRRLHYQLPPHAQGKLVRVTSGEVFDVAIDIRRSSPTFGKWVGAVLSSANHHQLWIPPGFAHAFITLSETAEFLYKTTDFYAPQSERSIIWNDPDIGIDWPFAGEPILSAKDQQAPGLAHAQVFE